LFKKQRLGASLVPPCTFRINHAGQAFEILRDLMCVSSHNS